MKKHKNLALALLFSCLPISISLLRTQQNVHMKMIMLYLNLNFLLHESFRMKGDGVISSFKTNINGSLKERKKKLLFRANGT